MAKIRHLSIEIEEYIAKWAMRGKTPTQIHQALLNERQFAGRVPTLRTVQTRVKEYRPPDASGSWSFIEADLADVRIVLDGLADIARLGFPLARGISNDLAAAILRLRTPRPDLPAMELVFLLAMYGSRTARHETTADLDAYLALAPWRDAEHWETYCQLVEHGTVPRLPHIDGAMLGVELLTETERQNLAAWQATSAADESDNQFDNQADNHADESA